jgi:hypothetical protein
MLFLQFLQKFTVVKYTFRKRMITIIFMYVIITLFAVIYYCKNLKQNAYSFLLYHILTPFWLFTTVSDKF